MYYDFSKLNSALMKLNMSPQLQYLSDFISVRGMLQSLLAGVPDSYARSYGQVQLIKYDEEGEPTDITPQAQLTVPDSVIAHAKAQQADIVSRLQRLQQKVNTMSPATTLTVNAMNIVDFLETSVGGIVLPYVSDTKVSNNRILATSAVDGITYGGVKPASALVMTCTAGNKGLYQVIVIYAGAFKNTVTEIVNSALLFGFTPLEPYANAPFAYMTIQGVAGMYESRFREAVKDVVLTGATTMNVFPVSNAMQLTGDQISASNRSMFFGTQRTLRINDQGEDFNVVIPTSLKDYGNYMKNLIHNFDEKTVTIDTATILDNLGATIVDPSW